MSAVEIQLLLPGIVLLLQLSRKKIKDHLILDYMADPPDEQGACTVESSEKYHRGAEPCMVSHRSFELDA